MLNVTKKVRKLNQAEYGMFIGVFCAVFGGYFYYFLNNAEEISRGIVNLELTFYVKVILVLSILCVIMWFLLFAATIWRGNDIGFPEFISVGVYLLPTLPRFMGMSLWGQHMLDLIEVSATLLFLITAGLYLYLPTDWANQEGKRKLDRVLFRIRNWISDKIS